MIKTLLKLLITVVAVTVLGFNDATTVIKPQRAIQTDTIKPRTDQNGKVYPTLPLNSKRLFYLQRSPNINALSYDVNIDVKTGKPDEDSPVHVYWLRYAEGRGETSELTFLQRKFAYGVTSNPLGNNKYDIRIMSYKKIPLTLMAATDGKYHIFATVAKKQMLLQNIFIQIEGGSMWSPNIIFVEMKGTDPITGKKVIERFKP
ncbi:DUF4833 domain-containing protein [Mucilaginibacter sp.]|uniref:DUF4833 domain-containing protein n=1 Tax=Mucilaginibacter sp. TaxID=1882438 RepID=UPI00262B21B4|nr:DUF4833 domain-containing protein [Mucilaginibacter sp.]MDB5126556.1 CDP-alcohol phosphatidyltransferase [Mucilaginibacter sp.]